MHAHLVRRKVGPGAPASASAEAISRAVARADRLIHDLLDVARLEGGSLRVFPGVHAPADLLQEALEAARPLAPGLRLALEGAPGALPPVAADRERVLQVLSNLLGNALKFTPAGGEVALGACAEGDAVHFWVRDSGPGIPLEAQAHLFERFWQAYRGDRRGAGLGLSIAKGIVEALQGRIWVESAPARAPPSTSRSPPPAPRAPPPARRTLRAPTHPEPRTHPPATKREKRPPMAPTEPGTDALATLTARYLDALLAGRLREAMRLVDAALEGGVPVADVQARVVRVAQRQLGELWEAGRASVACEHRASSISQLVLAHVFALAEPAPARGAALTLACVEGELHELPARLVSDYLELGGYAVTYLGANLPARSLLEHVAAHPPDLLCLSVTLPAHLPALSRTVKAVHRQLGPHLPVLVGGHAAERAPQVVAALGVGRVPGGAPEEVLAAVRDALASGPH